MKNIDMPVLAVGLMGLILGGCAKNARSIAYSPDGQSLAYVKKGHLVIRKDGNDSTVSKETPSSLSWSPDGAFLAWTSGAEMRMQVRKGEGPSRSHETTHIYALNSRVTAQAPDVGSPLTWLGGDLVVTDQRDSAKPKLALLDPRSAQTRTVVDLRETPIELAPGNLRREVYVQFHGDSDWQTFDGLNFALMPKTAGYEAFPLANGESVFSRDLYDDERQRFELYRWDGLALRKAASVQLPIHPGRGHSIILVSSLDGVADNLSRAIVSATVISGSPTAEQDLIKVLKHYPPNKVPANVNKRLAREFKHANFHELAYLWSADSAAKVAAILRSKEGGTNLALDPSGAHLAVVDTAGLRIVNLH